MNLRRLLVGLVAACHRHARLVVLVGLLLAAFSAWYSAGHLGVSTDTDQMFSASLPWRQRAIALQRDFPQFQDLLVAVIDADEPEEADATAAALAARWRPTMRISVGAPARRLALPRAGRAAVPRPAAAEALMDRTIDAQPFLGQLAADPQRARAVRGARAAGHGRRAGPGRSRRPIGPPSTAFTRRWRARSTAIRSRCPGARCSAASSPISPATTASSWCSRSSTTARCEPGGAATQAIRDAVAGLEFVKSGDARVRITGQRRAGRRGVRDRRARARSTGLIGSVVLITLWLFLAVRTWRLIVPILMTLGLGLMLTLLFAAARGRHAEPGLGRLRRAVRRHRGGFRDPVLRSAIARSARISPTGARRCGRPAAGSAAQILVAALATAAGLSRLRADRFSRRRGARADRRHRHADRVRLHADLPAGGDHACFARAARAAEVGLRLGGAARPACSRRRHAGAGGVRRPGAARRSRCCRGSSFDSDPLHTKNPNTEAMRTLVRPDG